MKQRQLGANGPMVSAIGLGCLSFGGIFGATTEADSLACLDAAWAAGITFLDTANIYGNGVSESVIGTWLASRGHRPVLATKAAIVTAPPRRIDNSAAYLEAELDASLRRLGVDHVDLFYVHRREAARPVEEVAEAMGRLIARGKIGGWGLSEVSPTTLRQAHAVTPVRAVQNEYSLWTRLPDLGMIAACADLGVAFVPFSPLARGALGADLPEPDQFGAGDFRRLIPRFAPAHWPQNLMRITAFRAYAADRGVSPPALALAWVLDRGDHLIPIPGTRSAAHLADWAGAADLALTEADRAAIDRILPPGWAWGDRYNDDQAATVERYC